MAVNNLGSSYFSFDYSRFIRFNYVKWRECDSLRVGFWRVNLHIIKTFYILRYWTFILSFKSLCRTCRIYWNPSFADNIDNIGFFFISFQIALKFNCFATLFDKIKQNLSGYHFLYFKINSRIPTNLSHFFSLCLLCFYKSNCIFDVVFFLLWTR